MRAGELCRRGAAEQAQRQCQLVPQELEDMAHAVLSRDGETVDRRATGEHRARPEGERLGDVGPATDTAVEIALDTAADRVAHLRQRVERGGSPVELTPAVIR